MVNNSVIVHGSIESVLSVCEKHQLNDIQKEMLKERLKREAERIKQENAQLQSIFKSQFVEVDPQVA